MNKYVIIHLSDIHYDGSEMSMKMIKNLYDDLEIMKKQFGEYNLLMITGDCIDKGNVSLFEDFGNKMNSIFKLAERKVLVAGNHDVNLKDNKVESIQKSIDENLSDSDIEKMVQKCGFDDFLDSKIKAHIKSIDGDVFYHNCNGLIIRCIAINSSWSTILGRKYGELMFGDNQLNKIKDMINKKKRKKVDFTIIAMHHPIDWFTYDERNKFSEFVQDVHADLILHGHVHESFHKTTLDIDDMLNVFCTGIAYNKKGENRSHKSGMRYSIYEIDKGAKVINVNVRITNEKGCFVGDNTLYKNADSNGSFSVPLESASKCLIPANCVSKESSKSFLIDREFFEMYKKKEERLLGFLINMGKVIVDLDNDREQQKVEFKRSHRIQKIGKKYEKKFEMEYACYKFWLFCGHIVHDLNAIFFSEHEDVRIMIRLYDSVTNSHKAFVADGLDSVDASMANVKAFEWGKGLIYQSYKTGKPLLKSTNLQYHEDGNTSNKWREYLTVAIDEGTIKVKSEKGRAELVPIASLNIASRSYDNDMCLKVLSMSTIFDVMKEVFKMFGSKVLEVSKLDFTFLNNYIKNGGTYE